MRERVEQMLAELKAGKDQVIANLHKQLGAIEALEMLLAEKPEEDAGQG